MPVTMLPFSIRYVNRKILNILLKSDWIVGLVIGGGGIGVIMGGIGKTLSV